MKITTLLVSNMNWLKMFINHFLVFQLCVYEAISYWVCAPWPQWFNNTPPCLHWRLLKSFLFPADRRWQGGHIDISLINLESRTLISVRPFCSQWRSLRALTSPLITPLVLCVVYLKRGPCSVNLLHVRCTWNMSSCQLGGPDGQSARPSLWCFLILLSTYLLVPTLPPRSSCVPGAHNSPAFGLLSVFCILLQFIPFSNYQFTQIKEMYPLNSGVRALQMVTVLHSLLE